MHPVMGGNTAIHIFFFLIFWDFGHITDITTFWNFYDNIYTYAAYMNDPTTGKTGYACNYDW